MKLFNYFLRHTSLFVAVVMLVSMAGCSGCDKNGDKRQELLEHVGNDALVVATFNIQKYIESAGGKVEDGTITMPEAVERLIKQIDGSDRKFANKVIDRITSIKGVNLQTAVVAIYDDGETKYGSQKTKGNILFYITDKDDFKDWIKEVGFDEDHSGDFEGYSYDDVETQIVLDGDVAYLMPGQESFSDAVDVVKEIQKSAKDKELAEWKKDYLCKDNTAITALVFFEDITEASEELDRIDELNSEARVLGIQHIIEGTHLQITATAMDKDGKAADVVTAANLSSLDPNIFTYFPDDYNFFGAMTLKGKLFDQVNKYFFQGFNEAMITAMFGDNISNYGSPMYDEYGYYNGYYNRMEAAIDTISRGPAFANPCRDASALGIGMGFTSGARLDLNHPERIIEHTSSRAVLSFGSPSNASDYYKAWSDLEMAGEVSTDQAIEFSPYYAPYKLYMMRKANDIVLSSARNFDTSSHSFPCKLDDAVAFAQINLPKSDPLIKALPLKVDFGIKLWAVATRNSVTLDITLTDTEGGFIENLLNMAVKIVSNIGELVGDDDYGTPVPDYSYAEADSAVAETYDYAPAEEAVVVEDDYYY